MILIAHRGNINGPNPKLENNPIYLMEALKMGFDVELDLWLVDNQWFLGHDKPDYNIDISFLKNKNLWIHCKNYNALQNLITFSSDLNFFYHTNEDYALTSRKYIWAYPGMFGGKYTICVMPEWNDTDTTSFAGICSDYIGKYK